MYLKNVCNVCLAMDTPMHDIADSSLEDVYIKLTNTSLNTGGRPLVACYFCYSQLRKCHNLMVRSVRAHKVLTQVLQSGEVVKGEFMTMIQLEACALINTLDITPVKVFSIASNYQHWLEVELKNDPLSQCKEEVEEDSLVSVKSENDDVVTAAREDGEGIGDEGEEDIKKEEPETAFDSERLEYEDAVQAEECEEIHLEKIEKETTLSPDDLYILKTQKPRKRKKPRTSRIVEGERPDRNSAYNLRITDKSANKRQVAKSTVGTSIHSDTTLNNDNIREDGDTDCTRTKIEVSEGFSNYLKNMFNSNDPDDVVDDKYILGLNDEGKNYQTIGGEMYENMIFKKNTIITGITNNGTKTVDDKKHFICTICQKKISRKAIRAHLKTHAVEKPYMCEICAQRFKDKIKFTVHLRKHNGERPFECDVCQAKFDQKHTLKCHLRKHTGEKPFKCDLCQEKFRTKTGHSVHLLRHTGKKPFECTICERRFYTKYGLVSHLRTHTLERPYECNICQKRFSYKNSCDRHLRTHSGVKPYECEQCQRQFSTSNRLKLHFRIHTGDRPFECDICHASFTRKDNLTAHLRIHTGERPFKCVICQRRFNQGSSLRTHMRSHNR